MYIIGLTGNIATGKSTVMKMLAELGAEIVDADRVAHDLMRPGGSAYLKVIAAFGKDIVKSDGEIDRKVLGTIVFNDADRLRVLDQIVHPLVVERLVASLPTIKKDVVAIEAIKLIEAGLASVCNAVWVVTSPKELQLKRLMEARGLKRADAKVRIDAQPSQKNKIAVAQVVIKNTGDLIALRQKVEEEWARIPPQPPLQT